MAVPPRENPCRSNPVCGVRLTTPDDSPVCSLSATKASKIGSDESRSEPDFPTEIPVTRQTTKTRATHDVTRETTRRLFSLELLESRDRDSVSWTGDAGFFLAIFLSFESFESFSQEILLINNLH